MADNSDKISITGTKEGIEKAMHEIRVTSDEQVIMVTRFAFNWCLYQISFLPSQNKHMNV